MNGPHDVGGRHGFGPIVPEKEGDLFHGDWEKRVLGVTLASAALGYWNIDASRHARESLPPAVYYGSSYYAIWLQALENLLVASEEITPDELATGTAVSAGKRADRMLKAEAVADVLEKGGPADRPGPMPRFQVGDAVRTKNHQPAGHCRLPGYARGVVGRIVAQHGAHVFPDSSARFQGEDPQPLYTVAFDAATLFGADADPHLTVQIEAWEPYIDPA